ncbi:hypothetical protein [Streptomyces sp. KL116D]|uniref:hypothetical protein n=1 Tax=Streptomyces sp. KL116D TaxID=3045152 RepID=UPI00355701CF
MPGEEHQAAGALRRVEPGADESRRVQHALAHGAGRVVGPPREAAHEDGVGFRFAGGDRRGQGRQVGVVLAESGQAAADGRAAHDRVVGPRQRPPGQPVEVVGARFLGVAVPRRAAGRAHGDGADLGDRRSGGVGHRQAHRGAVGRDRRHADGRG